VKLAGSAQGLQEGIALALRLKFGEEGRAASAPRSERSPIRPRFGRIAAGIESAASIEDVLRN